MGSTESSSFDSQNPREQADCIYIYIHILNFSINKAAIARNKNQNACTGHRIYTNIGGGQAAFGRRALLCWEVHEGSGGNEGSVTYSYLLNIVFTSSKATDREHRKVSMITTMGCSCHLRRDGRWSVTYKLVSEMGTFLLAA